MCGSPVLGAWSDLVEVQWAKDRGPSDGYHRLLESRAILRHRHQTIVAWGFRYLLAGVGMGLGVGLILWLLIPLDGVQNQKATLLFLAIALIIGAVVGGVLGSVGGVIHFRMKLDASKKIVIDDL
jgi:hypothetical protein